MRLGQGYAVGTITLDDGSVWSWKGRIWLSGMLALPPARTHMRALYPHRYEDRRPLTLEEKRGIAEARAACDASGKTATLLRDEEYIARIRCEARGGPALRRQRRGVGE